VLDRVQEPRQQRALSPARELKQLATAGLGRCTSAAKFLQDHEAIGAAMFL
jgi:hypothetical protein